MAALLLVSRLLLAGVFAVAAVAKLGDPTGARRGVRGSGGPRWLARPPALLLPFVELGIAIGLVPAASARAAAAGAVRATDATPQNRRRNRCERE